jgi:hypothetical protein
VTKGLIFTRETKELFYETFMIKTNTKGDENLVQLLRFVLKKRDENINQNTSY